MNLPLNILTSAIVLCATCTITNAEPRGGAKAGGFQRHQVRNGGIAEKRAENAAVREEALLDRIDTHTWQKDPEARDHRHEDLREYTNHTYRRIVKLLTLGALEEADGKKFKTRHAAIVASAKSANADGLDLDEKKTIRVQLNKLNDEINAAIKAPEQGNNRTPLVNRSQHRFEQLIAFGVSSGRLSTLEASSLRRKVKKLETTEDRLKKNDLTSNERKRLMKDVAELQRDLHKDLRD